MLGETTKKFLKIGIFVVIVFALALAIYFVFFRGASTTPVPSDLQTNLLINQITGQLPDFINGNVNQEPIGSVIGQPSENSGLLTDDQVAFQEKSLITERAIENRATAIKATINGVNYYSPNTNLFYHLTADGTIQELSPTPFYNVEKTTWTNDGNKAILEYPDGANIVYDFTTRKQYTLPKELQSFSFAGNGGEIAAKVIGPLPENNWLVTANADGSSIKFVESMGENSAKVDVNWSPNGQVIALYVKNSGINSQEVMLIGRNQENFYSLKTFGQGFKGVWTPAGDRLLYSVYSSDTGFRPTLWIVDAQGDNIGLNNKQLELNTWPDKCVFSDNQTVYCAVPKDLPEGSGIYPEMSKDSSDDFYKIDLKTGSYSQLPVTGTYSAKNLVLSPDKKSLYLEEAVSGDLIKISL